MLANGRASFNNDPGSDSVAHNITVSRANTILSPRFSFTARSFVLPFQITGYAAGAVLKSYPGVDPPWDNVIAGPRRGWLCFPVLAKSRGSLPESAGRALTMCHRVIFN